MKIEDEMWTCIKCNKKMEESMGAIQPHDGVVFFGRPGYGSSLDGDHQELDNVSEYAIVLCDDCMTSSREVIKGIKLTPQKPWTERASVVNLEANRQKLIDEKMFLPITSKEPI